MSKNTTAVNMSKSEFYASKCGFIEDIQLKCLVIGDLGVDITYLKHAVQSVNLHMAYGHVYTYGKTAIVRRYTEGGFTSSYKITVGADFILKTLLWDGKTRINLQLWDVAGDEKFGYMMRVYYKNAIAAAVVCDLTRNSTVTSVRKWLLDLREKVALPDGSAIPVIIMANKSDVIGSSPPLDTIKRMCKEFNVDSWFTASAKENINIDEAFNFLIRRSLQLKVYEKTHKKEEITINKPIFDKRMYQHRRTCC